MEQYKDTNWVWYDYLFYVTGLGIWFWIVCVGIITVIFNN